MVIFHFFFKLIKLPWSTFHVKTPLICKVGLGEIFWWRATYNTERLCLVCGDLLRDLDKNRMADLTAGFDTTNHAQYPLSQTWNSLVPVEHVRSQIDGQLKLNAQCRSFGLCGSSGLHNRVYPWVIYSIYMRTKLRCIHRMIPRTKQIVSILF